MDNPRYKGRFTQDDTKEQELTLIEAQNGAASCGDAMVLYWLIDPDTSIIKDARFQTFGCGTAIAAADATCELSIGKTVQEARNITNLEVEQHLRDDPETPAVPPQKMHCSVMAYEVIRDAAEKYTGITDTNDEDIVCECARVRKRTIIEAIQKHDLHSIEEIIQHTKAGGFCGSCIRPGGHEERQYYLGDILEDTRKDMDTVQNQNEMLSKLAASRNALDDIKNMKK